jgi:hypothetical protein
VAIRKKRLKYFGAAALFAALCLVFGTTATSQAVPAKGPAQPAVKLPLGMTADEYKYQQEQAPLDAVATKIATLANKSAAGRAGFFDTEVRPAQHTLIVYWHGAVPVDVGSLIARAQGPVHVRVVKTRYGLAALNQQLHLAFRNSGVVIGYPQTDGSGIVVGVRAQTTRSAAADLRTRITVPMTVTEAGSPVAQVCTFYAGDTHASPSRCHDYPPFWGGDVIEEYAQPGHVNSCTGGFGVHNSSGATYMMTAAHCATNGSSYVNGVTFYNGFNDATLGNITGVPGPHDGAIIPTSSGHSYYDGPGIRNGDTSITKTVAGSRTVSVYDSLCESGAFGGVHCGSIVSSTDARDGAWNSMALSSDLNGAYTVDGDSGGPWFSLDGSSSVWAEGIHHGLVSILGIQFELFTPISVLLTDTGTSVNIG